MKEKDTSEFRWIYDEFCRLESELELFDIVLNDIHIWELIRWGVHRRIVEKRNVFTPIMGSQNDTDGFAFGRYSGMLARTLKNSFMKNPFFAGTHDVMVFGTHRHEQNDDTGEWLDVHCDPLYKEIDLDYVHFDMISEPKPAATDTLRYIDLAENLQDILRKTWSLTPLGDDFIQCADDFRNARERFRETFDVDIPIDRMAHSVYLTQRFGVPVWRTLVRRIDPELVLVVASNHREPLVEACHREQVPVAELQHGAINK